MNLLFRLTILAAAIALPQAVLAQRSINIGSIFDAVGGVAQSQQVASMSDEEEITIGRELTARTLSTYPLIRDDKLQRYLNSVGRWVALQSEKPNLPWRFAGVQSSQINAFAVPGGTVLITQGMLKLLRNEAELACVIGHEIGHIVRRHHLNLLQKEILLNTGAKVVGDNLSGRSAAGNALGQAAIGEGAQLFNRSLDRGAEREADGDGVVHAARSGYDPAACQNFMQRMAALKGGDSSALGSLYKTHPQATDRASDIAGALSSLDGASAGSGSQPPLGYAIK